MSDQPTTALERHQPRAQAPAILDERAQASLRFRARSLAALDSRISKQKDPETRERMAVGLAITLDSLGLSIDPIQARKLHLISGDWTPSAQLMVELVQRRGHDIVPVTMTRERAVFRGRRFGTGDPIEIEYSIEDARESGALDEWVEKWEDGQNGRYLAGKFAVSTDGVPTGEEPPDWAKPLIAKGRTKKNEAWFKYRIDMLANRCVKRLSKWMAADALNGYGPVVAEAGWDDDVVVDAELVDQAAAAVDSDPGDVDEAEIVQEHDTEGGEVDVTDPPATPASDPTEEAFDPPAPRVELASQAWIDDVLANCAKVLEGGSLRPGALAAALVRKVTNGERSELATIRRGSEQTALKDRFVEFTDGRWQVEISPAGTATLVEAARDEA